MTFNASGADIAGERAVRSDNYNDYALLPLLLIRDKFIKCKSKEEHCNG